MKKKTPLILSHQYPYTDATPFYRNNEPANASAFHFEARAHENECTNAWKVWRLERAVQRESEAKAAGKVVRPASTRAQRLARQARSRARFAGRTRFDYTAEEAVAVAVPAALRAEHPETMAAARTMRNARKRQRQQRKP